MDSFWDFLWLVIISFLFFAYLMILFQIISDLFRDHSVSGGLKAVWMVCLIFFPVVTAVVYLIARGGGMAERQMQSAQEAQKNAEAYIQSVAGQGTSPADQISQAKALLDSGAISQAEFDSLKAKALS